MNIFIACGANDLQVLDKLHSGSYHLEESYFYGKRWDKIYCFEPTPDFPHMKLIVSKVLPNGEHWLIKGGKADPDYFVERFGPDTKIEYINKAIWTKNTKIDFYNWGSDRHYSNTMCPDKGKDRPTNEVDAIDFDEWLKENVSKEDYVFCDMDIECAEYKILPHLIKNKSIELIDDLAVEWHSSKCGSWFKGGDNVKLEKQLKKKTNILDHNEIGIG